MKTLLLASACLFITSVSASSLTVNEGEKILRNTLANTPACIVSDYFKNFPVVYDEFSDHRSKGPLLKAMSDAGLLTRTTKAVEVIKKTPFSKRKITIHAPVYSLSDLGKQYFKTDAVQISKNTRKKPKIGTGFCYADKLEVTGLDSYRGGATINYYLFVADKADWANHKSIISTGKIADLSGFGKMKPFLIKGQEPPPKGLRLQARFSKQANGEYKLTHF